MESGIFNFFYLQYQYIAIYIYNMLSLAFTELTCRNQEFGV